MNKINIAQYTFILALATQVLVGLGFGLVFLLNPQFGFESFNASSYNPSLGSTAVVMAILLFLSGAISVLGAMWTKQKNICGVIIGLAVGMELLLIGILAFTMYGNTTLLMIDGTRGLIILVSGLIIVKGKMFRKS